MADARRWSVSYTRRFIAVALAACAFFIMCAGVGLANWPVVALGVAILVLAVSLIVVTVVRGNARNFIRGTAHVIDVSEPPASVSAGRCELQIVVEAPGLTPAKVKIREPRVPVDKWPDIGAQVPVRVAIDDPRQVRVLWDEVRSHSEIAAEDERFNEYVQRIVDAELGPEDEAEPLPPGPSIVVPKPRPSPHRRRSTGNTSVAVAEAPGESPEPTTANPSANGPTANGPTSNGPTASPAAPIVGRANPGPMALVEETDEIPIIEIVPIEGASAVLGVRPARDTPLDTLPEDARPTADPVDAKAVADLLAAYPSARPGANTAIHGVGVTLFVTDLSRSLEFYRDMLGFHAIDTGPSSAVLASGETRISLRRVSDMAPVDRRLVQLNLEVGDVEAVYEELRAKGVKFIHRPRPVARGDQMELWAAAFRDPDGHGIALIRWQPRAGS